MAIIILILILFLGEITFLKKSKISLNKSLNKIKIEVEDEIRKKEVLTKQNQELITENENQKQKIIYYEKEINKLKEKLSSGAKASLLNERKNSFNRIIIPEEDQKDILKLQTFRQELKNPIILNKLIWTAYYQKEVKDLCTRLLPSSPCIGIYKITNVNTDQCYIGQSVNIADRFTQHCKCGCGINPPATNKLYQDMLKNQIWSFSFELLEECSKEDLNEKEKKWIDLFQSNVYGFNLTKGGS